jgi:tetratricopeptide (TPR) repeat protein
MDIWQSRIDALWADETLTDAERMVLIDVVCAERPVDDPRSLFERAGARDSAGLEVEAAPLYRRALEIGLTEELRAQAVIQLASTLRNLGHTEESLALLRGEIDREPASPLRESASAFYALALFSDGDAAAAASVALQALSPHLPRYSRSVLAYAQELSNTRI